MLKACLQEAVRIFVSPLPIPTYMAQVACIIHRSIYILLFSIQTCRNIYPRRTFLHIRKHSWRSIESVPSMAVEVSLIMAISSVACANDT